MNRIKNIYCSTCKHHKKGYCKKKRFYVSINADWCEDYKIRFILRIRKLLNL